MLPCGAGTSGDPDIFQTIGGVPFTNFTQTLNAPYVNTAAYGECVPGCVSWYTVVSGDYCAKIASDQGIFLNAFLVCASLCPLPLSPPALLLGAGPPTCNRSRMPAVRSATQAVRFAVHACRATTPASSPPTSATCCSPGSRSACAWPPAAPPLTTRTSMPSLPAACMHACILTCPACHHLTEIPVQQGIMRLLSTE